MNLTRRGKVKAVICILVVFFLIGTVGAADKDLISMTRFVYQFFGGITLLLALERWK